MRRFIFCCFVLMMGILATKSNAQGFFVRPMTMDFTPRAGQTITKEIELRNTQVEEVGFLSLEPMILGQSEGGQMVAFDPSHLDEKNEVFRKRSCVSWMSLNPLSVNVPPLQSKKVTLQIKVPFTAKGFYAGAILVKARPHPNDVTHKYQVNITIQFLIPIIINVQGSPAQERLRLKDVGMQFVPAQNNNTSTTGLYMSVANEGETYAHLEGTVSVSRRLGQTWRQLASAHIPESGIMPSITLMKGQDIQRRLPSGEYKLQADIKVGGRPKGRLEKIINFQGDPSATDPLSDAQIEIDPSPLAIDIIPGSTRSGSFVLHNLGDSSVQITASIDIPEELKGISMGPILGENYNCAPWADIVPKTFTLAKGLSRNLRVILRSPGSGLDRPNYFARLLLHTNYPDGQSAGDFKTLIVAKNSKATAANDINAQAIKMEMSQQETGKYGITAQFGNVGNTLFTPKGKLSLATPIGQTVNQTDMVTSVKEVLPLGTPEFSGVMDFSNIAPGGYILTATMEYAGKQISQTLPLKVTKKNGAIAVTVVDQTAAAAQPKAKPGSSTARTTKSKPTGSSVTKVKKV